MSDRDRLKQLVADTPAGGCHEDFTPVKIKDILGEDRIQRVVENLLSNGVIVPPCKVGDTVYFVVEYDGEYFLDEGEVGSVYKDGGGIWVSVRYYSGLHYHHKENDFGKTVFLTREEAEQALQKKGETK